MNTSYFDEIIESAEFIKERANFNPEIAIILGTGLGNMAQKLEIRKRNFI